MQADESLIRDVVQQVLAEVGKIPPLNQENTSHAGRNGIFTCVDEAVAAASAAFDELSRRPIADRKQVIDIIRRISIDQSVELGTMEMEETKIGRLAHKNRKAAHARRKNTRRRVPAKPSI